MSIDAQIPLQVAQQPSAVQQMGGAYQMAAMVEKQKEIQQQKQDQQTIQEALKGGANFDTPEGIKAAAEQLKGRVSPGTYQMLTQAHQESLANQAKMREYYAKAGNEELEGYSKKLDFMNQNVEVPLKAYEDAKAAGKTEQEATLAFESAKAQRVEQVKNMPSVGGQPLMPDNVVAQYAAGSPAEFKSKWATVKSNQENLKFAADLKYKEQQTAFLAEREKAAKKAEAAETTGGKGLVSAGAQVAAGMPITQVVPGMSKAQRAQQQAVRVEATNQIMTENPGMTETEAGIELAQRTIDYAATRAGRRTQTATVGATEANITMASSEARKMVAIVKDVASKMDLTEYPSINAVENAVSKGTGGTEIVRLNAALNGLTNTYARAINPKGTPTVEDKKEARIVIDNAMSHGQTLAALSVMDQEMEASLASPAAARKVLDRVRALGKTQSKTSEIPEGLPQGSNTDRTHS